MFHCDVVLENFRTVYPYPENIINEMRTKFSINGIRIITMRGFWHAMRQKNIAKYPISVKLITYDEFILFYM
ncbi:hypothetical protein DXE05_00750 [Vibrio parahaemolyticus]|nr:hypothetical protein DXE05_00750 [Vibrio parahaemolyticus]